MRQSPAASSNRGGGGFEARGCVSRALFWPFCRRRITLRIAPANNLLGFDAKLTGAAEFAAFFANPAATGRNTLGKDMIGRLYESTAPLPQMRSLADYSPTELEELFAAWGVPILHAKRLLRQYYDSAAELDLASPARRDRALPKALQKRIAEELPLFTTTLAECTQADDGTTKLLVRCPDGALVESVLMPEFRLQRAAGCLSTQVGCAMACDFCATGQQGFSRNLSAGEMVEQFLHLKRLSATHKLQLRTLVLMGMGEPLLNLENVAKAIRMIAGEQGGQIGWRHTTLSTVGLTPQLRQFVNMRLNVQLALSLHAPNDDLRGTIIPMARRYPMAELLALAEEHQRNTGRITIIQYCLMEGVNDSDECAQALAALLGERRMHVNLLTYNNTGRSYRASSPERVKGFLTILRDQHLVAHARRSRGDDIAAACGQLTSARTSPG